jgi:hypothetical protein
MGDANCPSSDELAAYAIGKLPIATIEVLAQHIEACPGCQAALTTLDDAQDSLTSRLSRVPHDPYLSEPQCQEAVTRTAAAIGEVLSGDGSSVDVRATEQAVPSQLGEYRLMEKLGEGGMGAVFKALHTKLKRVVAVKVLPRTVCGTRRPSLDLNVRWQRSAS